MLERVLDFFKKPTSRNIIINTIGNYINVVFVAFFAFLLVRIMQPSMYGVLSVLLGIAYVLANVLDFGTTASIYSYLPVMIENKQEKAFTFLKTIFIYQTTFSLIVITILLVSFPFLDKVFFKTGAPWWELYLTTFSVLFLIWQNYAINCLNAAKKFLQANLYLNLSNLIKTIIIFSLIPFKLVNVGSIIFVFGILGPVVFFIGLFVGKSHIFKKVLKAPVDKKEFRTGYTLTFFIANQFLNISSRMDLFLLSYFFSKSPQVGYYGLSQKIILTIMASIASITQVLSPNFSKIKTKQDIIQQLKHGLTYLLIPAGLFLLLYITPNQIFYIFFTKKFAQTALITKALSLAFIPYVFWQLPLLFILYTLKKPIVIFFANLIYFFIITIGCYIFIPKLGVHAPPYIIAVANIVGIAITATYSLFEIKKIS